MDAPVVYGRVCIDSGLDFTTWPHGGSTSACGYVETSGAERCPTELKAIFDGMERPAQLTKRPAPWDSHPGRPNLPSLAPQTRPPSLQAPREVQGGPQDASRCRGRARSPAAATNSSPARRASELPKSYIRPVHPRPSLFGHYQPPRGVRLPFKLPGRLEGVKRGEPVPWRQG